MEAVILGLDGGDWQIFNGFMEMGVMPNLSKLAKQGLTANLISTVPPSTPQAWSSIMTGLNAGRHGVFGFANLTSNTERKLNSLKSMAGKKLWNFLNEAGLSCGVFNVPMTYPPEPLNGFMVSGFMTPETATVFSYPQKISAEIKEKFPEYSVDLETPVGQADSELFVTHLSHLNKVHFKAAIWLAKKYQPDVLFFTSVLPDRLQHLYISYLQPDAKVKRSELAFKQKLKEAYQLLDDCIGELIASLQPKKIFVVSDHGFTREEGTFFLNDWLFQQKFLALNLNQLAKAKKKFLDFYFFRLDASQSWLKKKLGALLSKTPAKKVTKRTFKQQAKSDLTIIDWSQTKAFSAPIYQQGIYVSKQINDVKLYEQIRDELINQLKFYFFQQGQKVDVWKKEQLYQGSFLWAIPDLLLSINDFKVSCRDNLYLRSSLRLQPTGKGVHAPAGIFIAYGSQLNQELDVKELGITDFLPTFLASLGITSHNLDGKTYPLFKSSPTFTHG